MHRRAPDLRRGLLLAAVYGTWEIILFGVVRGKSVANLANRTPFANVLPANYSFQYIQL